MAKTDADFNSFYKRLLSEDNFICFPSDTPIEEIEITRQRNCFYVLVDIWSDASMVESEYKASPDSEKLSILLDKFHAHCNLLYKSFDAPEYRFIREECKVSEWMLHDVVAGKNSFEDSIDNAMKWFNRFCFGFNLRATNDEFLPTPKHQ